MRARKYWDRLLSVPNTLRFNFRYFPPRTALKLPVYVSHHAYLKRCRGSVTIDGPVTTGLVRLGFPEVGVFDEKRSRMVWHVNGSVVFAGRASIGQGSRVGVAGRLTMGRNFRVLAETTIVCRREITFGDDVLVSWECLFMDSDFHSLTTPSGEPLNEDRPICVGSHVWVGCRNTVFKGVRIPDGTVVAGNSNLHRSVEEPNCLVGGSPAQIIRRGIEWSHRAPAGPSPAAT